MPFHFTGILFLLSFHHSLAHFEEMCCDLVLALKASPCLFCWRHTVFRGTERETGEQWGGWCDLQGKDLHLGQVGALDKGKRKLHSLISSKDRGSRFCQFELLSWMERDEKSQGCHQGFLFWETGVKINICILLCSSLTWKGSVFLWQLK